MARTHGNRQKHESANPVQAWLIRRFHRQVVGLVRQVDAGSVLEVGCGEGYVLRALQEAGAGGRLAGVDRSAVAIAEARARLGDEVDLEVGDALTIGPAARRPDLVLMIEVLEHLEDPDAMLDRLGALTGRSVLLSVPWEPWFRLSNLARLKNVSRWGDDPEHVNHWTGRGFRRFVGRRLRVQAVRHPFPWTLVLAGR